MRERVSEFEICDESFISGRVLFSDLSETREPSRILTTKQLAFNSELFKRFSTRLWTICQPSISIETWSSITTTTDNLKNSSNASNASNSRRLHGSCINLFESPSACSSDDGWAVVMFLLEVTAIPAFQDAICVLYDNDGDFIEPLVVNLQQDDQTDELDDDDDNDDYDNEHYLSNAFNQRRSHGSAHSHHGSAHSHHGSAHSHHGSAHSHRRITLHTYIQSGQIHYVPHRGFRDCRSLLRLARNPAAFLDGICPKRLGQRLECLKSSLLLKPNQQQDVSSSHKFFGFSLVQATVTKDVALLFRAYPHLVPMAVRAALSSYSNNTAKTQWRKFNGCPEQIEPLLKLLKNNNSNNDTNANHLNIVQIPLPNVGKKISSDKYQTSSCSDDDGVLTAIPIPNIQLANLLAAENQNRLPRQFLLREWGFPRQISYNQNDSSVQISDRFGEDQIMDSRLIGSKISYGLYRLCRDFDVLGRLDGVQLLAAVPEDYLIVIDDAIKDWILDHSPIERYVPLNELVDDEINRLTDSAYMKIMSFEGFPVPDILTNQFRSYLARLIMFNRLRLFVIDRVEEIVKSQSSDPDNNSILPSVLSKSTSDFSKLSNPLLLSSSSYCHYRPDLFQLLINCIFKSNINFDRDWNNIFSGREIYFASQLNLTADDTDMRNILDVISGGEGNNLANILGLGSSDLEIPNLPKWEAYYNESDEEKSDDSDDDNNDNNGNAKNCKNELEEFMKAFEDLSLGKLLRSEIKHNEIQEGENNEIEESDDNNDQIQLEQLAAEEREFLNRLGKDVREDLISRPKAELWEQGITGSLVAEKNINGIGPTRLIADNIRRQYG